MLLVYLVCLVQEIIQAIKETLSLIIIYQTLKKNINLLNVSDNENAKFATKKWYITESKGNYSHENPINLLTKSVESSLCDYSDAYNLFTGDVAVKTSSI